MLERPAASPTPAGHVASTVESPDGRAPVVSVPPPSGDAVDHQSRSPFHVADEAALSLPAAAVPPDPAWQLDHSQLAAYEQLGRDFLDTTAGESAAETSPAALRRQWTAARTASDGRFEQFFGSERLAEQRLRAAGADAAAGAH